MSGALDGYLELSDKSGLGVELNYAQIEKHPYEARNYTGTYYIEGSVADV